MRIMLLIATFLFVLSGVVYAQTSGYISPDYGAGQTWNDSNGNSGYISPDYGAGRSYYGN